MLGKMRRYAPMKDVLKGCLGKTRWASEEAAQRVASRIRREEGTERMDTTVRPYRFRWTGKPHWHLGHGW